MATRYSIIPVIWMFLLFSLMLLGSVLADSSLLASRDLESHAHTCFLYQPNEPHNLQSRDNSNATNSTEYLIYPAEKWASWSDGDSSPDIDNSPDIDIPDIHYFRFTEENLNASKVDAFYAEWSIERQAVADWEIGEWKLFNGDFGNTLNFQCGAGFKHCIDKPTLSDLQRLWPGSKNRALVRRVYFVLMKYELLHAYTEEIMEMFQVTHTNLIGEVSELITTFTQQADGRKVSDCELVKMFIDQAVSIAVSVATSLIGGAISSVSSAGLKMAWSNSRYGKPDPSAIQKAQDALVATVTKDISGEVEKQTIESNLRFAMGNGVKDIKKQLDSLSSSFKIDANALKAYKVGLESAKPMSYDWFGLAWHQVFNYGPYVRLIDTKSHWKDLNIEGGMSHGGLCSQFEGDFKDNNAQNKEKMSKSLSQVFDKIRQQTQEAFGAVYDGVIIEPGKPSLMARMMSNRAWDGEGSALQNLQQPVNLQMNIEKAMIKNIASDLLARNYNYMKCTHHPHATKICRDAQNNDKKIGLSRFCPETETDPNLVCQLGKWYFSVMQQHEIEMVGIKAFSTFFDNKYNFTLTEFQNEAWDSYKTCGNNCSDTDWEALPFGGSISSKWKLPTCVNDDIHLNDFFIHQGKVNNQNAWAFPSICGDFRSNETQGFMEALHIGIGSKAYTGRDASELWEDRIPRELDDLPPYENYMALCKLGVRFPRHGENPDKKTTPVKGVVGPAVKYKYYHWGSDVDCDKVTESTADMDEYDANDWFCFSPIGQQIQDKQRDHVDMAHIPRRVLFGAKKKCEKWGWEGGGIRNGRPEHGKGAKIWKAERSSRESKWRTTTSSSMKPTGTPTVSVLVTTTEHITDHVTHDHTELLITTVYLDPSTSVVETWTRTNPDGSPIPTVYLDPSTLAVDTRTRTNSDGSSIPTVSAVADGKQRDVDENTT